VFLIFNLKSGAATHVSLTQPMEEGLAGFPISREEYVSLVEDPSGVRNYTLDYNGADCTVHRVENLERYLNNFIQVPDGDKADVLIHVDNSCISMTCSAKYPRDGVEALTLIERSNPLKPRASFHLSPGTQRELKFVFGDASWLVVNWNDLTLYVTRPYKDMTYAYNNPLRSK
jgi:hypothetical protein